MERCYRATSSVHSTVQMQTSESYTLIDHFCKIRYENHAIGDVNILVILSLSLSLSHQQCNHITLRISDVGQFNVGS
jgi:hypothetical protein